MEAWIHFNGEADGGGDPPGGTWCPVCGDNDIETEEVDASEVISDPKRKLCAKCGKDQRDHLAPHPMPGHQFVEEA